MKQLEINNKNNLKFVRLFSKNPNSKFVQFKEGYKEMNIKVQEFAKTPAISRLNLFSWVFMLCGYCSMIIAYSGWSIIGTKYTLLISLVEFFISFVFTMWVFIKELLFIYNYDLKCNSRVFSKGMSIAELSVLPIGKVIGMTLGVVASLNWTIYSFRGVDVLAEYGRDWMDGDKSFGEVTKSTAKKVMDGYKLRGID